MRKHNRKRNTPIRGLAESIMLFTFGNRKAKLVKGETLILADNGIYRVRAKP